MLLGQFMPCPPDASINVIQIVAHCRDRVLTYLPLECSQSVICKVHSISIKLRGQYNFELYAVPLGVLFDELFQLKGALIPPIGN